MAANQGPYKKNYRALVVTIWVEKMKEDWTPPTELGDTMRRLAWQYEICPTTHQIHLQVRRTDLTPRLIPVGCGRLT